MPEFGVVPLEHLWCKKVSSHALGIYLQKGEAVDDALLAMIDRLEKNVYITHVYGNREPLRVSCSPEALGRVNPKTLCLMGVVEELDDAIFQHCTALEHLWIGGSGDRPLLASAPYLTRCPLKYMGFQGWGVVVLGHDLDKIIVRLQKEQRGSVEFLF